MIFILEMLNWFNFIYFSPQPHPLNPTISTTVIQFDSYQLASSDSNTVQFISKLSHQQSACPGLLYELLWIVWRSDIWTHKPIAIIYRDEEVRFLPSRDADMP